MERDQIKKYTKVKNSVHEPLVEHTATCYASVQVVYPLSVMLVMKGASSISPGFVGVFVVGRGLRFIFFSNYICMCMW